MSPRHSVVEEGAAAKPKEKSKAAVEPVENKGRAGRSRFPMPEASRPTEMTLAAFLSKPTRGAGGQAGSVNGTFYSGGGSGGDGGELNLLTVTHSGSIQTQRDGSHGLEALSISGGGGGGAGGAASSVIAGIGGSGGSPAGDAGNIALNLSGSTVTFGTAAYGVFASSVGAGAAEPTRWVRSSPSPSEAAAEMAVTEGSSTSTNRASFNPRGAMPWVW